VKRHISIDECELVAKCVHCGKIKVLRFGDPFEVGLMIDRYIDTLHAAQWQHDHGGHWFCPDCIDEKPRG